MARPEAGKEFRIGVITTPPMPKVGSRAPEAACTRGEEPRLNTNRLAVPPRTSVRTKTLFEHIFSPACWGLLPYGHRVIEMGIGIIVDL
jgi:hypothetical protein